MNAYIRSLSGYLGRCREDFLTECHRCDIERNDGRWVCNRDAYEAVAELNGYAGTSDEEDMRGHGISLFFGAESDGRKGVMLPRLTGDPDKKWEDLTDPEYCPDQGYFYDD